MVSHDETVHPSRAGLSWPLDDSMKMAMANLTHSCVTMTAERQVVAGVYLRVRAGCIPNCRARRLMEAMASKPREGVEGAGAGRLLLADVVMILSILCG